MAQNEALARRINDRIEHQRPRNGELADTFICECVRVDRGGVLDLSIEEYARVRSHPRRFVVLPGHEEPAVESTGEVYPVMSWSKSAESRDGSRKPRRAAS